VETRKELDQVREMESEQGGGTGSLKLDDDRV